MVRNLKVSIADFHKKLRESDPNSSIEATLSRTTHNPLLEDDIFAVRSFMGLPISTLPLHLNEVMITNKRPHETPERVTHILRWRSHRGNAIDDQLRAIQLLVEWRRGREAAQARLSCESEEMLHGRYETLLLDFWKRVGQRG